MEPLTLEEEQHYLKLSHQGDMIARNLLVEHNLRLVAHIVKKYNNFDRDKDDLISIGTIGLIKAINTYNAEKGHRLVTYASRCIENELLMMLRQERKTAKDTSLYEPIGVDKEGNEIHLLDILGADEVDIVQKIDQEENIRKLYRCLNRMEASREKDTLIMRYGLYGREPMTQKEVAQKLQISRSYVSRIEKKAVKTVKRMMETRL
nr:RNA polymerase sporulation sigma factor SigK [Anaerostipes sp. 494a]